MDFNKKTESLDRLIANARQKQSPLGICMTFNSPALLEVALAHGYSWIMIDLEHTELALTGYTELMRVADASGLPWFVKLPSWDPVMARDILDFGAFGLVIGFVETTEQLREMYEGIRYPPDGKRGWCSIARSVDHVSYVVRNRRQMRAEYFKFTNERALIIPTIESVKAVNNVDELMKFDGCPIWHVGTDDLGLDLLGADAPFDDDYGKEVMKVAMAIERKVHAAGKMLTSFFSPFPGARTKGVEDLQLLNSELPYSSDAWMFGVGLAETKAITDEYRARQQ